MKNFLRIISLTLILALLIQIIPLSVIANTVNKADPINTSELSENPITGECKELRGKYSKVYEREDGAKVVLISSDALHYEKDNNFIEIDNSLEESDSADGKVLKNKSNSFGVELPKNLDDGKVIKVTNGGYTLSFAFSGNMDASSGKIRNNKDVDKKDNKTASVEAYDQADVEKKNASVTYGDVMENIDIEYAVEAEKLKENIILQEKPVNDVAFSYTVNTPKLTAEINQDNSIAFYAGKDKKAVKFYLPAPVMFDSGNVSCADIKVELKKVGNGSYTLTYQPSMMWLQGESTAYPVTLDPVIMAEQSTSAIDDTYVSNETSAIANTNYGAGTALCSFTGGAYKAESLLRLNTLPDIPGDAVITKANIYLYNTGTGPAVMNNICVRGLSGSWNESTVTYNSTEYSNLQRTAFSADAVRNDCDQTGYFSLNITKLFKDWYTTGTTYRSLVLYSGGGTKISYSSSEGPAGQKPYMAVEYRSVSGISYGNDNHTQTLGRAGTVYVNDFSGALCVERTDMAFGGSRLPAEIKWFCNTNESANDIGYGYGVRNVYSETLQYTPASATVPTAFYTLKSGDGGTRYLDMLEASDDPNAPNVKDEQSGEEYVMKQLTVSGCTAYSLTDNESTTKYYRCGDTSATSFKYLYQIEEVPSERLTRVAAAAEEAEDHFIVRFGDGVDRTLSILSTDGNTIRTEDANTKKQYTIVCADSSGNTSYTLTDGSAAVRHYQSTQSSGNAYKTQYLCAKEVGAAITNLVKDSIDFDISYTSGRISEIKYAKAVSSSPEVWYSYVFNYTGNRLASVSYKGSGASVLSSVGYGYDTTGRLTSVTFPDNQQISYVWNTAGNELTVTNTDNAALVYTFSTGAIQQVTNIQEKGTDGTPGNDMDIAYGVSQTTFTDNDGNIQVESFDAYGNTVSCRDGNGNAIYGAFGGDSGEGRNLLTGRSDIKRPIFSLLQNGDFEETGLASPVAVANPGEGVAEGTFSGTAEHPAFSGNYCYKVSKSGAAAAEISAMALVPNVAVSKYYTVSCWVKTLGANASAQLVIVGGTFNPGSSKEVKTNGKWQYLQATVFTTEDPAYASISFGVLLKNAGDFYIDNVQLEQANPANPFNLVKNGTFSDGTDHWSIYEYDNEPYTTIDSDDVIDTLIPAKLDENRLKITGKYSEARNSSQTINVNGKSGETYTFGGWACAVDAYGPSEMDGDMYARSLSITAVVPASVTQGDEIELARIEFNTYVANWQYEQSSFTLSADYAAVEIRLNYDFHERKAYFDGIELTKEALYKEFDASDNLVNVPSATQGDDAASGEETDSGISTESVTDGYGNETKTTETNGQVSILQSKTYTANGDFLASSTDELGNTTQYSYNEQLGLLTGVEDAKNNVINYVYNSVQQNTSVSQTVNNPYDQSGPLSVTNTYAYNDSDTLSSLTTANQQQYEFTYDIWCNPTQISLGNTDLATYTYTDDAERSLAKITYANGQIFEHIKDLDGKGNVDAFVYWEGEGLDASFYWLVYYNDFYEPYMLTVNENGKYLIFRDGLTEEYVPGTGLLAPPTVIHSYGENDLADGQEFLEKIGETGVKSTYTHKRDGNPKLAVIEANGGVEAQIKQEYRYDAFNRLSSTGAYEGSGAEAPDNAAVWTNYLYTDLPGFRTSNQVAAMDISGSTGTNGYHLSYHYKYDALGNITDIYTGGALSAHYEYDELSRLIRADDARQNKSFTYQYDAGGNILCKKEYAFTTGTLGAATDTVQYGYSTGDWKDKLTSYDSKAITSDASGNPLSYDGWAYTWEGGRQLRSMSNEATETEISYSYDHNGIRTGKTVNDVETQYTVVDSRITHQKTGDDDIYYFYDENGGLVSLNVGGDNYFYVRNLQNDIAAITDVDGSIVVEYTYDAWGKLISTTGSMAATIGALNPFRYRSYFYDTETGLYYLQSRYYNPEWGRFVNADDPIILLAAQGQVCGTNLFGYCDNNPVMNVDPNGEFPISLAAMELLTNFLVFCTVLLAIVALYSSTPSFRSSWSQFCYALSNGLSSINTAILRGGRAAWSWSRYKISAAIAAVSLYTAIVKADAEIRTKIRSSSKTRYWSATLKKNYVDIGRPLTYSQAVKEVQKGHNVFTVTKAEAKAVAKAAGANKSPVGPEIDSGKNNIKGYYWHFHAYNRSGGHVFYLI